MSNPDDVGASNFNKMVSPLITAQMLIGSQDPFKVPKYDPTIAFIEERFMRDFNNPATGTRNASGFSEVEVDAPCHIMGEVWLSYARGAVTSTSVDSKGAGYFLDHEVYSSIDHVDLLSGSTVVYRITGDQMKKRYYLEWTDAQRQADAAGAAAMRSEQERKALAASAQVLRARLIFPWTGNSDAYPYICGLNSKFRIRVYWKPFVQCFHHPGSNGAPTGGAITACRLFFDGYHVTQSKLNQMMAILAAKGQAVKFNDYEAQLSDTFTTTDATTQTRTLTLANILGPVPDFEIYLRHQEHLNDARALSEPYCLPLTNAQLLSNNKDVIIVEDLTKSAYGTLPDNSNVYDNMLLRPNAAPGVKYCQVLSWAPKLVAAQNLYGNAACLRQVNRYNNLQLKLTFPGSLCNTGLARPYCVRSFVNEQGTGGLAMTVENLQLDVYTNTANIFRVVGGAFRVDSKYSA